MSIQINYCQNSYHSLSRRIHSKKHFKKQEHMNNSNINSDKYPESPEPGMNYWLNKNKKKNDYFVPEGSKNKGDVKEYVIRCVTNPHTNPPIPIAERHIHYDLGDKSSICPHSSANQPCAICEFIEQQQKQMKELCDIHKIAKGDFKRPNGDTPSRVEQIPELNKVWLSYKDLYTKKRGYISLIVRGEESQGVKFWSVGAKLLDSIIDKIGAAEGMVDRYRGYDSIIKVKNVGKFFNGKPSPEIDFQFDAFGERKPILPGRPPEEIDALIATVKDISSFAPIPTYGETQAVLNNYKTWFENKFNSLQK